MSPKNDKELHDKTVTFIEHLHAQAFYKEIELAYAVTLLRVARPYLESMIGVESGMRVVLPFVDEFLQHHPEEKKADAPQT